MCYSNNPASAPRENLVRRKPSWKNRANNFAYAMGASFISLLWAAERISFRQIKRRTGHRLKEKLIDSVTGQAIDAANKARGYEVGENEFLMVEDRNLEQARRAPGTR